MPAHLIFVNIIGAAILIYLVVVEIRDTRNDAKEEENDDLTMSV